MAEGGEDIDLVKDIVKTPFSRQTFQEKLDISLLDLRTYYQQLHSNILDNILCQIRNRFQDHEKCMFISLLDPQHFQTYRKKIPQTAFSSLTEIHGTLFDLSKLKTELIVMYAMTDFEWKSPSDLLGFLKQKNLNEDMW